MAINDRVGNVYLDVLPKGDQFNAGVQALINKAERDAKFNVDANTQKAQQQVKQLSDQIQNDVGGSWVAAAAQAAAFTGAVFAVRAAVEGVVNKFSELFDGIAKARAGFNSILGEKGGENLLSQVRQFAIDSPFVTGELVSYSQQLLGVGKAANTIVPTLKNVGDIVASVGGDTSNLGSILYALTQIQTIGKLTGQDARQLQNQLVPITKYISEYTGKSVADVKKLQEAGGIASDVVFKAIEAQGKKVEGALNNSVRTIQGAKSVLTDTFQNFLQTSPALNNIYNDLVSGIQKFAAAIAKPEVKRYIDEFLNSVGRLYEALKPLITQFASLAGSGGLTALSGFTRILETFATVIDSIPTPALNAIATALAALATIKAPLALFQYAQNIQRIATGLLGGGGLLNGLTRTTASMSASAVATSEAAIAANQATLAYKNMGQQMALTAEQSAFLESQFNSMNAKASLFQRLRQGLSTSSGTRTAGIVGAGIAGGLIQANADPTNELAQGAGGALTYGAIGAQLGASAGPAGLAVGAAVGAAYGALTGYLDASDKKLEDQIEKNRELGQKAAEAYLHENEKLFSSATPAAVSKITGDLQTTKAAIEAIKKIRDEGVDSAYDNGVDRAVDNFLPGESDSDKIKNDAKKNIALQEDTLKAQQAIYDKYAQPILDTVQKLREANLGDPFLKDLKSPASVGSDPVKGFEDLDAAFRQYGITLNDVVNDPAGAIALVTQIEALDTAQKAAVVSANLLTEALKNAKGDSDAIYANQIANLNSASGAINALEAAKKAAIDANAPGTSDASRQLADLAAQSTLAQAKSAAGTQAVAETVVASDAAITAAKKLGLDVLADWIKTNEDAAKVAARTNAEDKVTTDVLNAQNVALRENARARDIATKARDRARIGTDISAQQSALGSLTGARQAAGAANLNQNNQVLQLAAQKALFDAQEAAAALAATEATRAAQDKLQRAIDSGVVKVGDAEYKRQQYDIAASAALAEREARQRVLNDVTQAGIDIEREAAAIRAKGNAAALEYLNNLQRGQILANQIFGATLAQAQAISSQISAITAVGSALGDVLLDGTTATESAALTTNLVSAQISQFAAVFASTANEIEANSAAMAYYNTVVEASKISIDDVTTKVIGLNGILDRVDGRKAIAEISVNGIQAALAQIAQLELTMAKLNTEAGLVAAAGGSLSPEFQSNAASNQAYLDELNHVLAIYEGRIPDDRGLLGNIGAQAQAAIQDTLDAEAEKARKEAEAEAKRAQDAAEKYAKAVESATDSLTDKLQSAADAMTAAADKWVASIKERTQYDQAVSVGRLTKNATSQAKDLTEIAAGLANLRGRGVSEDVLKALGIDSVADTRQLRKLVKSSDSDLAKLNSAVSARGTQALSLATSEEQAQQKKTITEAIIDAAKQLEFGTTPAEAAAIAASITITQGMDAGALANEILSALSGGKIG